MVQESSQGRICYPCRLGSVQMTVQHFQNKPVHNVCMHPACPDHCTLRSKLKSVFSLSAKTALPHTKKWQIFRQQNRHLILAASEDKAQVSGIELTSGVTERETNARVRAEARLPVIKTTFDSCHDRRLLLRSKTWISPMISPSATFLSCPSARSSYHKRPFLCSFLSRGIDCSSSLSNNPPPEDLD